MQKFRIIEFIIQTGEERRAESSKAAVSGLKPVMITSAPVSRIQRGIFSTLKFLKYSQSLYRQKIFLPGMAGSVWIEQTHKAIFDRRIEVVAQKVFPVRQIQLFHHSLDRTRIVTDCQYEFLTGGIFRNQLVGYLWGTCGVLVGSACGVNSSGAEMTR